MSMDWPKDFAPLEQVPKGHQIRLYQTARTNCNLTTVACACGETIGGIRPTDGPNVALALYATHNTGDKNDN